jgi:uncharacterized membrane protein
MHGAYFLGGIGLGAGAMYLLDPDRGRSRRAHLRDQIVSCLNEFGDAIDVIGRDLGHRATGMVAEGRAIFSTEEASDRVLSERVRSKIGRVLSHPGAIEVTARDGKISLTGHVLEHEVADLLSCVSGVHGVQGVDNQLQAHKEAGNIPDLQGGRVPPGDQFDLLQRNWAPATRFVMGLLGGGMFLFGLRQRFPTACVLGTVGLGLAARSMSNLETKRLLGFGGGRRAIDVQKTLTINAPPEQVFRFWSNYANFGRFMSNVREVRDLGNGRSHWVAEGPGGIPVTWNAVLTRVEPNNVLAWKSEEGSVIANAGFVRFEDTGDGRTRVDLHFSYNPPGGALGHLAASLFGADPKSKMDEDLVRLKSLLEEGKTSAPGKGHTESAALTGAGPAAGRQAGPAARSNR